MQNHYIFESYKIEFLKHFSGLKKQLIGFLQLYL